VKRKIIIGLGLHAIIFIAGGIYILQTIHGATARLDNLIRLHQVEILREHYLIQIRRVQTDLTLKGTRHPGHADADEHLFQLPSHAAGAGPNSGTETTHRSVSGWLEQGADDPGQ
jgi:hypothetical protein